jgi:hypothetical protein
MPHSIAIDPYGFVPACVFVLGFLALAAALAWFLLRGRSGRLSFLERLCVLFFIAIILSGVNWVVGEFLVFDQLLGGDAIGGKIEGDRYFLGRGSEEYTEVSKELYWFSYWYFRLSAFAFPVAFGGCLATGISARRQRRRQWLQRVRTLAERNDLQALCDLIELLDDRMPFKAGKGAEDLRHVCEAIRQKTQAIGVPSLFLPLSADEPREVRTEHKEIWRAWVKAHEAALSKCFGRRQGQDGGSSCHNPPSL